MINFNKNITIALDYLKGIVLGEIYSHSLQKLSMIPLEDERFIKGFGSREKHHDYEGGLVIHTAEVVDICSNVLRASVGFLKSDILLTSAIWHDYLKIRDYVWNEKDNKIISTEYNQHIYHPSGSAMEFYHQANSLSEGEKPSQEEIDQIMHCILSHHGRLDWRTVVEPQTPEAWTLHYADCMSAWFGENRLDRDIFTPYLNG